VESESFREMIYLLRKDTFIPSADTIKNDIIAMFEESQKKIRSILQVTYLYFSNNIFIQILLIIILIFVEYS
jgi:hypothetical protein